MTRASRLAPAAAWSALVAACTVMNGYSYPLVGSGSADAATDAPAVSEAGTDAGLYASQVLASQPLAYYRLDEPPGATVAHDSSGHGNDCQYTAGVDLGVPGIVPGETAVRLPGQGLGVTCPPSLFAFSGSAPFTVEGWYAPAPVGATYESAFSRLTPHPRSGYYVYLQGSPASVGFEFYDDDNDTCFADGTPFPCDGSSDGGGPCAFDYVVATYDGATMAVYVNGALGKTSQCPQGPPAAVGVPFTIGNYSGLECTTCALVGAIDDVAVYGRALSASEVQDHYAAAGH